MMKARAIWTGLMITLAVGGIGAQPVSPTASPTPCLPPPIAPPQAVYPPDGAMNVPLTVDFQWEPSCGAADLYLTRQGATEELVCTEAAGSCTVGPLVPGSTYTWRFHIEDATSCHECLTSIGGGDWTFATLNVIVNYPPTGGTFAVSPGGGVPLSTVFSMIASDWTDPEENYPLEYRFSFYPSGSPGSETVIRAFDESATAQSVLPTGLIIPVLTVRDSLGNEVRIEHPAVPVGTATPTPQPSATATATPTACFPGDADNSCGFVDAGDFMAVQANFGADNGPGGPGDADCSGSFVDAGDFIAVQANFGAACE